MKATLTKDGKLIMSERVVERIGLNRIIIDNNFQWYGLIECESNYTEPNPFTISFVYTTHPSYKEKLYPIIKRGNIFYLNLLNSVLLEYMKPANYILECNNREAKYFFTYRLIRCAEKINENEINFSKSGVNNTKHKRNNIKKGNRSI